MDVKDLADSKRRLGVVLCQDIREFEQKTGLEVTGIKIKRQDTAESLPPIESVIVKVDVPDE